MSFINRLTCNTFFHKAFQKSLLLNVFPHLLTSHRTTCFYRYGHNQMFKIIVWKKLMCFHFVVPASLLCGSVYALVYPIVLGQSSCCAVWIMIAFCNVNGNCCDFQCIFLILNIASAGRTSFITFYTRTRSKYVELYLYLYLYLWILVHIISLEGHFEITV
jgi:hypothetical protein